MKQCSANQARNQLNRHIPAQRNYFSFCNLFLFVIILSLGFQICLVAETQSDTVTISASFVDNLSNQELVVLLREYSLILLEATNPDESGVRILKCRTDTDPLLICQQLKKDLVVWDAYCVDRIDTSIAEEEFDTIIIATAFINDFSNQQLVTLLRKYSLILLEATNPDELGIQIMKCRTNRDPLLICQKLKSDSQVYFAHCIYSIDNSIEALLSGRLDEQSQASVSLLLYGNKAASGIIEKLNQMNITEKACPLIQMLGFIGNETDGIVIQNILNNGENIKPVKIYCYYSLAELGGKLNKEYLEDKLLNDADNSMKEVIITALTNIADTETITKLKTFFKNTTETKLKIYAAYTIIKSCDTSVLTYLRDILTNETDLKFTEKVWAINGLVYSGDTNDIEIIESYLDDRNKMVKEAVQLSQMQIKMRNMSDTEKTNYIDEEILNKQTNISFIIYYFGIKELLKIEGEEKNKILSKILINDSYWNSNESLYEKYNNLNTVLLNMRQKKIKIK